MTKQDILDTFKDINFVYNNSSKHETLSQMLDELLQETESAYKRWYEKGFNDAMQGKQELMYEGIDGKWHKKDW